MTIFDIVNYQFRRPSFLPLVDGGNSTCYVRTYVERRSYRCQREQYFSAKPGEGVGDRARERKRVKSARCRGASGRETERMRERAIKERTGKGERDVSPRQENGGVPARTLNLLNALARAWNASISLFYFGPLVRRPFSPVSAIPSFLLPFVERPNERTDRPTGGRNPFSRRALAPVRADLMTLPPRSDDDSIVYDQLKWSTCKLSFFTAPAFYLVLDGRVSDGSEWPFYWFNPARYGECKRELLSD